MMLIKKRNSAVFQALTPCVSATTRTNTDIRLNNIAEDIIQRIPCRACEMGFFIFLLPMEPTEANPDMDKMPVSFIH
jgi:hypothetical protein